MASALVIFSIKVNLPYVKMVQESALKACFQIAECSLSYAKIVQVSAMKACFLIAECSLSYAKVHNFVTIQR